MAKRRKAQQVAPGPSKFFIVALIVGVLVLAWAFVAYVNSPPARATPTSR